MYTNVTEFFRHVNTCVCACVLPPVSKQKVISQPSPDENALSISLNTLPCENTTTPTSHTHHTEQFKLTIWTKAS